MAGCYVARLAFRRTAAAMAHGAPRRRSATRRLGTRRRAHSAGDPSEPSARAPPIISLTDHQLSIVTAHAEPLPAYDRDRYLHRVASLLQGQEIGDGAVARAHGRPKPHCFRRPSCTAPPACRGHCASCSGPDHRPPESAPLSATARPHQPRERLQPLRGPKGDTYVPWSSPMTTAQGDDQPEWLTQQVSAFRKLAARASSSVQNQRAFALVRP